ncbi:peptidoglycan-binding protein [Kitasatospora sp. NPDC101155]|uniref:peptidoglycan-binding domain-containing protein n=1 Tax=Kitasatospora sp. NPDC101155 TaxID=3364097 RepID=UPI003801BFE1
MKLKRHALRTAVVATAATAAMTLMSSAWADPGAAWLSYNDTGLGVKCVQMAVNSAGYDAGKVDGKWGNQTEAAVEAFQTHKFGYADGIVGPRTGDAMWPYVKDYNGWCYSVLPTSF